MLKNNVRDSLVSLLSTKTCLTNVKVKNWFECDVAAVSFFNGSFFWHEYEIKRSVQDFKRDFNKSCEAGVKHELLREGSTDCPNFFWFVVPDKIYKHIPPVNKKYGFLTFSSEAGGFSVKKSANGIHFDPVPNTRLCQFLGLC